MLEKSKRLIPIGIFFIFYMVCFGLLEQSNVSYHVINSSLDSRIPFCEYFVIPYFIWFPYIAGTVLFFVYGNDSLEEYWSLILNLGFGMTLFLVISYVYPNGLAIRPVNFPRENVFTDMVRHLYQTDTPTNVLPSIHVYNSVVAFCAINDCKKLQNHKVIRVSAFLLSFSIILSTMFLKQHSVNDVALGITFAVAAYIFIYRSQASLVSDTPTKAKRPIKRSRAVSKKRSWKGFR